MFYNSTSSETTETSEDVTENCLVFFGSLNIPMEKSVGVIRNLCTGQRALLVEQRERRKNRNIKMSLKTCGYFNWNFIEYRRSSRRTYTMDS